MSDTNSGYDFKEAESAILEILSKCRYRTEPITMVMLLEKIKTEFIIEATLDNMIELKEKRITLIGSNDR